MEHSLSVSVSLSAGATGEPGSCEARRGGGFDTRRSRYFRFPSSRRRRHHVKKKEKKRGKKSGTKKEDKWADAASASDSWDGAAGGPDASRFPQFPLPLRPRSQRSWENSLIFSYQECLLVFTTTGPRAMRRCQLVHCCLWFVGVVFWSRTTVKFC